MKLYHPNIDHENRERVQADIPNHIFNYFFKQVLAGEHRARQVLINTFFQKLYDACIDCGIKPEWDPANNSDITKLLERLNFDVVSASGRRTNSRAAVTKTQPAGSSDV